MLRRVLLALPALFLAATAAAVPAVGEPAPDFTLKDATGNAVKLSDFRGRFVVLEWTNPGCPFVRKHYDSGNMAATQAVNYVRQGIAEAVAGKPLSATTTRAYGCSIKYKS